MGRVLKVSNYDKVFSDQRAGTLTKEQLPWDVPGVNTPNNFAIMFMNNMKNSMFNVTIVSKRRACLLRSLTLMQSLEELKESRKSGQYVDGRVLKSQGLLNNLQNKIITRIWSSSIRTPPPLHPPPQCRSLGNTLLKSFNLPLYHPLVQRLRLRGS